MSRHEYLPPGWPEHRSFVIGWDDPLGTYFALVIDTATGTDQQDLIAAFGGEPPRFRELDNLMRVVNARIPDRLPSIQLPGELRRALRQDAKSQRPIVNSMTVTAPGEPEPESPLTRLCRALGTHLDYLDAEELRDVMDGMADTFFRLERLYLARKAEGLTEHNDGDTKRIRGSLANMEMICHVLGGFLQACDILVAEAALQPFFQRSAEAAQVLQAHAAEADTHPVSVH